MHRKWILSQVASSLKVGFNILSEKRHLVHCWFLIWLSTKSLLYKISLCNWSCVCVFLKIPLISTWKSCPLTFVVALITKLCLAAFCGPMSCSPSGPLVSEVFPGKNSRMGCCFLPQGPFQTRGSNPSLHLAGGFLTTEPQSSSILFHAKAPHKY